MLNEFCSREKAYDEKSDPNRSVKYSLGGSACSTIELAIRQRLYLNASDSSGTRAEQIIEQSARLCVRNWSHYIKKIAPTSSNEVFRKVPGLNVVDEEGAGLRLNVGVRGLDPDRSRNVLMLEDGIPIALNPYGEPEMYFTPAIEKMSRIEVLKGSGQILFGPQTIGGVVNMITADPPEQSTSQLRIRTGSGGYLSTYASHGSTHGRIGYLVSYLNKRADNMGPTRFNLNDISTKLRMRLSDRSTLGIKLGA